MPAWREIVRVTRRAARESIRTYFRPLGIALSLLARLCRFSWSVFLAMFGEILFEEERTATGMLKGAAAVVLLLAFAICVCFLLDDAGLVPLDRSTTLLMIAIYAVLIVIGIFRRSGG